MRLEDLSEDPTPDEIRHLVREDLEKLEYTRLRWLCACEGCTGGTHVRDYGISPWYFLDRNSKRSWKLPQDYWMQLSWRVWLCSKHNKLYRRLLKHYDVEHIWRRMRMAYGGSINNLIPIKPGPDGQQ